MLIPFEIMMSLTGTAETLKLACDDAWLLSARVATRSRPPKWVGVKRGHAALQQKKCPKKLN